MSKTIDGARVLETDELEKMRAIAMDERVRNLLATVAVKDDEISMFRKYAEEYRDKLSKLASRHETLKSWSRVSHATAVLGWGLLILTWIEIGA